MRLGVLTGGGDAPGLNAAIRGVAWSAFERGSEVIGIRNGWRGLVDQPDAYELAYKDVSGILNIGGTILGASRVNPLKRPDGLDSVRASLEGLKVDALVVIGGDDTQAVGAALSRSGYPVVGVPKTMDNDLAGTEYCIGFSTAVETVTDAIDKLHTTASAHHRVLVVEVMGRDAGWVAVTGGMAGGANMILIPELAKSVEEVCCHLQKRKSEGKDSSIIVVSEGFTSPDLQNGHDAGKLDEFGHPRLDRRNVGEVLANAVETRTGMETRVTVLGYLQRGGPPNAFDRVMATRLGVQATEFAHAGRFGVLAGVREGRVQAVDLEEVAGKNRLVDLDLYRVAEIFF